MRIKCGSLTVNLSSPIFKSISISNKSKTILAIGEGFYMKFYFNSRQGDTFYGDFIETVSLDGRQDKIFEEVAR